ncbi:2TM domain-containing protein [Aestuariibaculum sediminum]|uniref:2TM domain-containing protein n=1 Tax=Aestuariibaculum sediminum TaxID=2770637 RepID=A0A8J6Q0F2_9FLAO|nr:2TM domain-containing protein [Aestuariibaculum sediminum]MBD0833138.1 2TM domain-containing protein [Aestuariibaculum sediminum]
MRSLRKNTESPFNKEDAYLRAENRIKKLKGFYWHLFWYVIINLFLIILKLVYDLNDEFWSFNTFSTAIFWGVGLCFHAFGVFGKHLIFSRDWENRKIQEFLDKDKNQWE